MKLYDNNPLRIITLSGTEGVTKNLIVYECGNDIIAVDCGIGFPDSETLGVDVVIPDISYLVENKERLRGFFITHGHEDHFGALPYILPELNAPIYSGKLVQGFLRERFKEKLSKKQARSVSLNLISPETGETEAGCFKVSAFRVNHSVPGSMGFAIRTPQGLILHMADFRIDWNPILDEPIDLAAITKYGREGVLCLLSDCLGSTTEGYSQSESTLSETFDELMGRAAGKQLFVTTISSNISRMHQIMTSAVKHNRKVVLGGRSINQSVKVAKSLGYLPFEDSLFVGHKEARKYLQKDLVYIIAGCYGQPGSALERLSRGENRHFELEEDALVVFSADPSPPGTQEDVEKVMDLLTLAGAEVVYSQIQEDLHVSGHGTKGDLMEIASVVKPKYFIPIGGTIMKMRAYRNMVEGLDYSKESVFELLEGESVVFEGGKARKGDTVKVRQVYIDGTTIGEVGSVVIKDREHLSTEGVYVVVVPISKKTKKLVGKVEVVTRGFVYVKRSKGLVGKSKNLVNNIISKRKSDLSDWNSVKNEIEREVSKFLHKRTGRRPLIIVTNVTV